MHKQINSKIIRFTLILLTFISVVILANFMSFDGIFLLVVHPDGLNEELILQLVLLNLGQLGELVYYLRVVLQPAGSYNLSCLPISFSLGHLVVLVSHMHVPGSVSCIYFTTSVEARERLGKLLCASSHMLLSLTAIWTVRNVATQGWMIVVNVLKQIIYKLILGSFTVFNGNIKHFRLGEHLSFS